MFFNRSDFLQVLYDGLAGKSKVKTSKRVVSVEQNDEEARVILSDGTEEVGDIIIGCDGVHSAVGKAIKDQTVIPVTTSNDNSRELLLFQRHIR